MVIKGLRAVIRGHNLYHLLQLSLLDVTGEDGITGEDWCYVRLAYRRNATGDNFNVTAA